MVAGGQGTMATTGYGGGGEVRRSSQVHAVLNYAEDNLNEEWSSGWWDQGMVGGVVVETKGGRCFSVSCQGGGRKVTWASIRAAAPMIMAVQFSAVNLSFATGTQGYLGTISYLQLEIAL